MVTALQLCLCHPSPEVGWSVDIYEPVLGDGARQALLDLGPELPYVGSHRVEQADAQSRVLACTFVPTGVLLRLVRPTSLTA